MNHYQSFQYQSGCDNQKNSACRQIQLAEAVVLFYLYFNSLIQLNDLKVLKKEPSLTFRTVPRHAYRGV